MPIEKQEFKLEDPFQDKELPVVKEEVEVDIPKEQATLEDVSEEALKLPERVPDEQDLMLSRSRDLKDFHNHDGTNSELVDFLYINNFIETVTTVPTHTPKRLYEQIKLFIDDIDSPTDTKLYIYSNKAQVWNFIQFNGLAGTKVYYVSDSSGGAVNRKLTFLNGVLTSET